MESLREFIEKASGVAEALFNAKGRVPPMYQISCPAGSGVIPAPPFDKDQSVAIVRGLLEEIEATRVVFIDEAWMLDAVKEEVDAYIRTGASLEYHPKREERVVFMAEDATEGALLAHRNIDRSGLNAKLGPLEIATQEGTLSGRMVGLLPNNAKEKQ